MYDMNTATIELVANLAEIQVLLNNNMKSLDRLSKDMRDLLNGLRLSDDNARRAYTHLDAFIAQDIRLGIVNQIKKLLDNEVK